MPPLSPLVREAAETAERGERLSLEHGAALFADAPLSLLGALADRARRSLHPDDVCTFVVDTNLNYTNVCNVLCKFCAFYRLPKDEEAYDLPLDEILDRVAELVRMGGTQVLMQGGVNPAYTIERYEEIFGAITERFPQVDIHSLSAAEIEWLGKKHKMPWVEVFGRLKAAGYKSLPGAGAEMLVDRVRQEISPLRSGRDTWLEIHRAAHEAGVPSTATMTYGFGETPLETMEHFDVLRRLQDDTGGFTAFICWGFQPGGTELEHLEAPGGEAYLRHCAVGRLMLDNFPHLQAGWVTDGPKLCQLALTYGCDDFGGVVLHEEVVRATGVHHAVGPREAVRLIRDIGRVPAQRDTYYNVLRTFPEGEEYPLPEPRAAAFPVPVLD